MMSASEKEKLGEDWNLPTCQLEQEITLDLQGQISRDSSIGQKAEFQSYAQVWITLESVSGVWRTEHIWDFIESSDMHPGDKC